MVLLLGALVLGVVPVEAGAADGTSKVIGQGSRLKGSSRIWFAQGTALAPKTVSARVVPVPAQSVKVQWALACQRPNKFDPSFHLATKSSSGEVSLHAAGTVKLAFPYPKPPTCVATVYATLEKRGRLTLRLLQT
jgi:hypothetical protein